MFHLICLSESIFLSPVIRMSTINLHYNACENIINLFNKLKNINFFNTSNDNITNSLTNLLWQKLWFSTINCICHLHSFTLAYHSVTLYSLQNRLVEHVFKLIVHEH